MIRFTEEEKCIVDIYRDQSRLHTLEKMYRSLPDIDSDDIRKMVESVISKLLRTGDREYRAVLREQSFLAQLVREE